MSARTARRRSASSRGHAHDEVFAITGVRKGLTEDVDGRARRYLISMSLRSVCFVGGVLTDGWLRWVLLGGALLLPYVAVVLANGGRENASGAVPTIAPPERLALPGAAPSAGERRDDAA